MLNTATETHLMGRRNGSLHEEIMLMDATNPKRVKYIMALAKKEGWGHFRIRVLTFTGKPDFIGTLDI